MRTRELEKKLTEFQEGANDSALGESKFLVYSVEKLLQQYKGRAQNIMAERVSSVMIGPLERQIKTVSALDQPAVKEMADNMNPAYLEDFLTRSSMIAFDGTPAAVKAFAESYDGPCAEDFYPEREREYIIANFRKNYPDLI
ncbi:hypothetical protein GOV11_00275 [Candidatus Woesearchaeota archaeon]|nr:hypothetical protein [Candidatus Woesearchaeota archaeon]